MTRRPRVLFIAEAVTLAHVARASVLAATLDRDEFDIHVAWDSRYDRLLGRLPFERHQIQSLDSAEFLRRVSRGAPMHDRATLRAYVEEDLALIHQVRPDVLVGDFRLSLAASARLAGIPLIAVANASWSPYGSQTFQFPEYDYPLSGAIGDAAARRLFAWLRPIGFAAHTRPLNQVLRERGLPGIGGDIRTMYTFGDLTAYADIPGLVPLPSLPEHHAFVGAVLWSPEVTRPAWWDTLPDKRPIVYVTLGSSGDRTVLPVVLAALADLPITVVAASAGGPSLQPIPANAFVAEFLPGIEAAARASLVICNGGSPTTSQALAAGVPVLALPSNNMDQHLNMDAVRLAGAGLCLRTRGLTAESVRRAVQHLIDAPTLRMAARRLAEQSSTCRPQDRFPPLVRRLVGR